MIPNADLKALYLASTSPDEVLAGAEIIAEPEVDVISVLHLKGIGFEGVIDHVQDCEPSQSTTRNFLERRYFSCSEFSLEELGDPVFIFTGAQTEETASAKPLDEMAWQMVEILQDR